MDREVVRVNQAFVGTGCVRFAPDEVCYTVSQLKKRMKLEIKR